MALPNGNWETASLCIDDLIDALDTARGKVEDWDIQAASTITAINLISDATIKTACQKLYTQSMYNQKALEMLTYYKEANTPSYHVPYFLKHYVGGETYELTAGKIMAAWIDADKDARLMTVLTLDELRREAWTQEFFSYKIAPPGEG